MFSNNIKIGIAVACIIILSIFIGWLIFLNIFAQKYVLPQNYESRLAELKKNHPEFTDPQMNFYTNQAANGNVQPCRGRTDQSGCVLAVAFLDNNYQFCGEIEDVQKKRECTDLLLPQVAQKGISDCITLTTPDFKIACLSGIFNYYQQSQDCVIFKDPAVSKVCEGTIYLRQAQLERNAKMCDNISDSFIKMYCLQSLSVR